MRLEYRILWFEDIESSFNAKKRLVKRVVEDLGFIFPDPKNEVDSTNLDKIDFQFFDLIIADLNLANGERGSEILTTIREKGVYTEVVFYSSQGEDYVRSELAKFQIDGAYCADRANDDFIDKVEKVILTTIKKVQDLNNIRGLIMAETSDIDNTMLSIIKAVLEKDSFGLAKPLAARIFKNVNSKVTSKKDDFDKFQKNARLDKVIKDPVMFDSFQKIQAIQFIYDSIDHEITTPHKGDSFSVSYQELKRTRDLLAHVIEIYEDGRTKLKSGESEFEFTHEFCIEIRLKVKKHGLNLNSLNTLIANS